MSLFESDYPIEKKRTYGTIAEFSTVTLARGVDYLDFSGFSTEDVAEISRAISLTWTKGIQRQEDQGDSIRIKLRGFPWMARISASSDLVNSRKMMCAILAALWERNWILLFAFDSKAGAKDALMFKAQPTVGTHHWFAIHFLKDDTFCTINATPAFNNAVINKLGSLVQNQSYETDALVVKIFGWPFSNRDSARGNRIEILLMETIVSQSCETYACINMEESEYPRDSWICRTT